MMPFVPLCFIVDTAARARPTLKCSLGTFLFLRPCFHLGVVTYIQPVQWGGYTLRSTLTVHLVMMVSFLVLLCWNGRTFLKTDGHSRMSGTSSSSPYFLDRVLSRFFMSSLTSSSILTTYLTLPQNLQRNIWLCIIIWFCWFVFKWVEWIEVGIRKTNEVNLNLPWEFSSEYSVLFIPT